MSEAEALRSVVESISNYFFTLLKCHRAARSRLQQKGLFRRPLRVKTKLIRRGICLILCLPLCIGLGYLSLSFLPKVYFSKVVTPLDPSPVGELPTGPAMRKPIHAAIEELRLADKWSTDGKRLPTEEAYAKVLKMLAIRIIPNTGLFQIGVYSSDPQEAANIANTVAVQIRKQRIDKRVQVVNIGLAELAEAVDKQRLKVEKIHSEQLINIMDVPEKAGAQETDLNAKYAALKAEYSREKQILDDRVTRYENEKRQPRSIPRLPLWEKAEPSSNPVSPNLHAVLLISSGIGLLFAIPGIVSLCKVLRIK